jgi:hypothetical protein
MASPIPREVKGVSVRPVDVLVGNLPPSTPPDQVAELARAGKIIDEGVYMIDLYREAGGRQRKRSICTHRTQEVASDSGRAGLYAHR